MNSRGVPHPRNIWASQTHPFLVLGLSLWCCGRAGKPPGEGTGPSITTAIANKSEKKRKGKPMQRGTNTNLCKNFARDASKDVQNHRHKSNAQKNSLREKLSKFHGKFDRCI